MLRVINLVDSLAPVNFGIFNAAISTADKLLSNHQIASEIWYPMASRKAGDLPELYGATHYGIADTSLKGLGKAIADRDLSPATCLIVSHGAWQFPTKWAHKMKQQDYKWMYVPHGMLEPWSMSQKAFKKKLYFSFVEKPAARNADVIRCVSTSEGQNLLNDFQRVLWIPNGVNQVELALKSASTKHFLFLGRLHHKKGVLPLVLAWQQSRLNNDPSYVLHIAGPDEGEGEKIGPLIPKSSNIKFYGAVYGQQKADLLNLAHYFLLPSASEGFPTTVVETMAKGALPIISEGCNFNEVFQTPFSIKVEQEVTSIKQGLEKAADIDYGQFSKLSQAAGQFIEAGFTTSIIAAKQADSFSKLLANAMLPGLLKKSR